MIRQLVSENRQEVSGLTDRHDAALNVVERPFDLDAAHMQGHRWVDIARPLIKAYLALGMAQSDVLVAAYEAHPNFARDIRHAAHRIANVMRDLLSDIEGVRDVVLGDLSPPAPNWGRPLPEYGPEVDDYDDLCDMWEERIRDVVSVDMAIDREARRDD